MTDSAPTEPIKVCFISFKAYPLFNPAVEKTFGGAEVDLYLLATELARDENFQVSFVVGDYGQQRQEVRENVILIKSLDVYKNLFLGSRRIWRALRQADAQIYISESCSLGTVLNAYFCKCRRRRFVYRTASSRECDGTYFRQHRFRAPAVAWSFRSAAAIITQNDTDAENLLRTTGLSSMVIRNSCRLAPLSTGRRTSILWAGRSAPVKRPELFIELARQMPDQHFTMICQKYTKDNRYDELRAQAEQLANLKFICHVPFHQIDSFFQQARLFVNTSDSEGFPNTFLQACKCATPILSLTVNPDGFLDNYNCGLCSRGNQQVFIDQFKKLMDPQTAQEFGSNARRYAEDNHDITKIIESYKTIFRQFS